MSLLRCLGGDAGHPWSARPLPMAPVRPELPPSRAARFPEPPSQEEELGEPYCLRGLSFGDHRASAIVHLLEVNHESQSYSRGGEQEKFHVERQIRAPVCMS